MRSTVIHEMLSPRKGTVLVQYLYRNKRPNHRNVLSCLLVEVATLSCDTSNANITILNTWYVSCEFDNFKDRCVGASICVPGVYPLVVVKSQGAWWTLPAANSARTPESVWRAHVRVGPGLGGIKVPSG